MKVLSLMKRATIAAVAAAALIGPVTAAQALQFSAGDAVLVLYGNGTEYYRNLGTLANLSSPGGSSFTINSSFMSQLGGVAPIEFTILGGTAANFGAAPTSTFEGSAIPSTNTSATTGWSSSRNAFIDQTQLWNTLVNWAGQVGTIAGSEGVLGASDSRSFTNFFGTADRLNGAFNLRMSANADSDLFLLTRAFLPQGTQIAQDALGKATLTAGGQFTFAPVAPVPVPAAVILFGSGLVALVGLARRKRA